MKGIILLSHGPMAEGLYNTTKWFLGEDIPQYEYLCLQPDAVLEEFDNQIKATIEKVDSGEGVILFTDLQGGTPCNRCIQFMSDKVDLITGMNLTIVLEQLGNRLSDRYDFESLLSVGQNGIVHVNKMTSNTSDEDDFLN